ncbi:MAG TPA: hypothetical protein ENK57_23760 [Polyangiaceae bacterium]|nr:hypothetical protein [Polyangiaceae bacterium]
MSERLEMLDKVIAAGGDDPFPRYARAMELRSLSRPEDALEAFAELRERYPDYVATYLMAAQVAQSLDLEEDAARWARQGIEKAEAAGDERAVRELGQLLTLLE